VLCSGGKEQDYDLNISEGVKGTSWWQRVVQGVAIKFSVACA